jgi:hypothetical protein
VSSKLDSMAAKLAMILFGSRKPIKAILRLLGIESYRSRHPLIIYKHLTRLEGQGTTTLLGKIFVEYSLQHEESSLGKLAKRSQLWKLAHSAEMVALRAVSSSTREKRKAR